MSNSPLSLIKQQVRDSKIYMLPDIDYQIKANQNENPWDIPGSIKQEIARALLRRNWNRYPTLTAPEIRTSIAGSLGLIMEQVAVGNGSNEIMLAVMQMLLGTGRRLVTIEPTFSLYRHYGELLDSTVTAIRLEEQFSFPVSSLVETVKKNDVTLTILCTPNNPTGNSLSEVDLQKILETSRGFVLVDEAYVDFSKQEFLPLLEEYPNLILTRTFSKAFAFGFGRFGYAIASQDFIGELYKVLLPYNLNGLSGIAAEILLKRRDVLQPMIDQIIDQREWLLKALKSISGLTVYPSDANFILVKPKKPADEIINALLKKRILVRNVSHYPGLGNHFRISVGSPEENELMVEKLKGILK